MMDTAKSRRMTKNKNEGKRFSTRVGNGVMAISWHGLAPAVLSFTKGPGGSARLGVYIYTTGLDNYTRMLEIQV